MTWPAGRDGLTVRTVPLGTRCRYRPRDAGQIDLRRGGTVDSTATVEQTTVQDDAAAPVVEQDLLVEDVSIDGMCGVY